MGKILVEKERNISRLYTKKPSTETRNEQEATSSSSSLRAKKRQDSLIYSTSIVNELDLDNYYLFVDFKILE